MAMGQSRAVCTLRSAGAAELNISIPTTSTTQGELHFRQVTPAYQKLVLYDSRTADLIGSLPAGPAARKFASKAMPKFLSKVCVQGALNLSLEVYEQVFTKVDIESRVGLTDDHVAKVLETYQVLLKHRFKVEGKIGDSDVQLGGHGTAPAHHFVVFEPG